MKMSRAQRAARKLDWCEEEILSELFYRAWGDEIRCPDGADYTNADLRKWMRVAERKIIAAVRRIRKKQYRFYKTKVICD